jgi:hypothetical protein
MELSFAFVMTLSIHPLGTAALDSFGGIIAPSSPCCVGVDVLNVIINYLPICGTSAFRHWAWRALLGAVTRFIIACFLIAHMMLPRYRLLYHTHLTRLEHARAWTSAVGAPRACNG